MDPVEVGRFFGVGVVSREGTGRSQDTGKMWFRVKIVAYGTTHSFMVTEEVYSGVPEAAGRSLFCLTMDQKSVASTTKKGSFINELYEGRLESVGLQALAMLTHFAQAGGVTLPDPLAPTSGRASRQTAS